jgi:hypothetical protein
MLPNDFAYSRSIDLIESSRLLVRYHRLSTPGTRELLDRTARIIADSHELLFNSDWIVDAWPSVPRCSRDESRQ